MTSFFHERGYVNVNIGLIYSPFISIIKIVSGFRKVVDAANETYAVYISN